MIENLPANAGYTGLPTPVFLAWEILWTEEPAAIIHGVAESQTQQGNQTTTKFLEETFPMKTEYI